MYSNASNARANRETRMRPEERGAADRVTAMHGALNLPLERGGSEKNAPLILHQRPTKKAAKNGTRYPIERPGPTCRCSSDIASDDRRSHKPARATLAFFSSLHRGELPLRKPSDLCTFFRQLRNKSRRDRSCTIIELMNIVRSF